MNFEQVGGVSIPKKLDSKDLKKSGGLGKVLQRLNIIFEQTNKKLRGENTSVAGKMTIAGEKHYAQVISYIDRNQLFTDPGSSNSKVVNSLISGNDAFVFDKKTNRNSSKTLAKIMKKHNIKNSIFNLNGQLKQLYLRGSNIETHEFGKNQRAYDVTAESQSEKTLKEQLPSLLQDFFSFSERKPVILLNRTMPSDSELLDMFKMPQKGRYGQSLPGFMMLGRHFVFISDKIGFNLIPIETKIKGKRVTLCAIGMYFNKYGISKELEVAFEKSKSKMEKKIMGSVVSVSENTLNATSRKLTRRLTPKRMQLSPSPKTTSSSRTPPPLPRKLKDKTQSESEKTPPLPRKLKDRTPSVSEGSAKKAKKPFITKKFNKVVNDGETVSPEAVQLLFTNSPRSNIVPRSNTRVIYGSVAGKKKSKKKTKKTKKN